MANELIDYYTNPLGTDSSVIPTDNSVFEAGLSLSQIGKDFLCEPIDDSMIKDAYSILVMIKPLDQTVILEFFL